MTILPSIAPAKPPGESPKSGSRGRVKALDEPTSPAARAGSLPQLSPGRACVTADQILPSPPKAAKPDTAAPRKKRESRVESQDESASKIQRVYRKRRERTSKGQKSAGQAVPVEVVHEQPLKEVGDVENSYELVELPLAARPKDAIDLRNEELDRWQKNKSVLVLQRFGRCIIAKRRVATRSDAVKKSRDAKRSKYIQDRIDDLDSRMQWHRAHWDVAATVIQAAFKEKIGHDTKNEAMRLKARRARFNVGKDAARKRYTRFTREGLRRENAAQQASTESLALALNFVLKDRLEEEKEERKERELEQEELNKLANDIQREIDGRQEQKSQEEQNRQLSHQRFVEWEAWKLEHFHSEMEDTAHMLEVKKKYYEMMHDREAKAEMKRAAAHQQQAAEHKHRHTEELQLAASQGHEQDYQATVIGCCYRSHRARLAVTNKRCSKEVSHHKALIIQRNWKAHQARQIVLIRKSERDRIRAGRRSGTDATSIARLEEMALWHLHEMCIAQMRVAIWWKFLSAYRKHRCVLEAKLHPILHNIAPEQRMASQFPAIVSITTGLDSSKSSWMGLAALWNASHIEVGSPLLPNSTSARTQHV